MDVQNNIDFSEDTGIVLKEYEILVDLLKYHHSQLQDFNRTFLFANIVLAGAAVFILQTKSYDAPAFLTPLCLLGTAVSTVWMCITEKIYVDSDLRWFQLRYIERRLMRTDGIFTTGREFFQKKTLKSPDGRDDPLRFPAGLKGLLARFRIMWTGLLLPLFFICLYIALIFI